MKQALWAGFVALLLLAGWSVVQAREARREAMARADRVHAEWTEAARQAEELGNALALEQERTAAVLEHLAIQRNRADSLAVVTARRAAENEREALEMGETLAESLRNAKEASPPEVAALLEVAEGQLAEHLAADARTAAAFRAQIAALSEGRAAEAEAARIWERRARLAEETLEAERVACRLCEAEVVELRGAKDPSFLEDVWSHGKIFAAGAGAVLLFLLAR